MDYETKLAGGVHRLHIIPLTQDLGDGQFQEVRAYTLSVLDEEGSPIGGVLEIYDTEPEAEEAAEQFIECYEIALGEGYEFTGDYFEHPDGSRLLSVEAVEPENSPADFLTLLRERRQV